MYGYATLSYNQILDHLKILSTHSAVTTAVLKVHLRHLAVNFYPPTRKGSGDIAISLASVRLSVCPSVDKSLCAQ